MIPVFHCCVRGGHEEHIMGITQTRTPIKVQKRNEACMKDEGEQAGHHSAQWDDRYKTC